MHDPDRYNRDSTDHRLGILCLDEHLPDDIVPSGILDVTNFEHEVIYETVEGATLQRVLDADPTLATPFIDASQRLVHRRSSAIVSNCGFAVIYQTAVQRSTTVPVALSPLLLLPTLETLLPPKGRIAVLTFDSEKLTKQHLKYAWPTFSSLKCSIVGIENTKAWTQICRYSAYEWPEIRRSLIGRASMAISQADVDVILLECAAFIDFSGEIRDRFRKPVFDLVSMSDLLMRNV